MENRILFFCIWLLIIALNSCNTTKYLGEDDYLLRGNSIKLKSKEKIRNKPSLTYQLSELYKQKKNSRWLLLVPREWIYYRTQDPHDTTKLDDWQRRVLAEPPAIYDDSLAILTTQSMESDLVERGFYNANVYYTKYFKGKKAYVTYHVDPGKRHTVNSIEFSSKDRAIAQELNSIKEESNFREGSPLDHRLYPKERDRIVRHMQNNGYAYFLPNYVSRIDADTFAAPQKANLYLEVTPPFSDSVHRVHTIGEIKIYPNYSPIIADSRLSDTLISGYHFIDTTTEFAVKPAVIAEAISLRTGDLFSLTAREKTDRRLRALGIFKFVRIRSERDPEQPNVINFNILLSPNKKMESRLDFELNYTNRNSAAVTGNLFGVTLSPSLRNRNLLKGAELLVTNLSGGVEFDPGLRGTSFWNTIDLGVQSELYIPKFIDYLGLWKFADKIRPGRWDRDSRKRFYTRLKENALSRFSASYNYVLVLQFYRYNLVNASFGYDLQRANTHRYIINHFGMDYLFPIPEDPLLQIFEDNPFFERSFGKQLFTSFLFRDFTLIYNSPVNDKGKSNHVTFNVETAGSEIWAANKISNALGNRQDTFKLGEIEFSQYIRAALDLRYYKQITPKQSFAVRGYLGLARPFGFSGDVPYVKQFSVGGPNSIRAWVQRGLGPGGYIDTLAHNVNNRYRLDRDNRLRLYQQGDLKMEFNFEYRFNLYWQLDAAIFFDAGNIWTINADSDRCGSQFRFSEANTPGCEGPANVNDPFYKQIALGTGVGFRFDLTYFILRFDFATRLRYPFPLDRTGRITEADYWNSFEGWGLRDLNFNLGFGYPF